MKDVDSKLIRVQPESGRLDMDIQKVKRRSNGAVEKRSCKVCEPGKQTDPLRSGAGKYYSIIETIPKGAKVIVAGKSIMVDEKKWFCVKHGNNMGYCSGDYLKS